MYYDMKYRIVSVDCEALRLQLCGQVTSSMVWTTPELEVSELTGLHRTRVIPSHSRRRPRRNVGLAANLDDISACL
jgi:hypothetical protein